MTDEEQIYILVDIETDGAVPGLSSMLSLGAVATTNDKEVGSFYKKLLPIEGSSPNPKTMAWWQTQPEAWQEATSNAEPADKVMKDFVDWLNTFNKQPLFVAHPIAFDYTFVSWYLWKFTNSNPFIGENDAPLGLDIPSFIAGKFKTSYEQSRRSKLPGWMKEGMPEHSHNALDDARGFGVILRNILKNQDNYL